MIKGILFDLDGTLINTWDLYLEAYRLTARDYLKKEFSEEEIESMKLTTEMNFINRLIPEGKRREAYQRFLENYKKAHGSHFKGVYRGIHHMLEKLWNANYRLGLVTGKSRKALEQTHSELDLDIFEVIITNNEVSQPKPDPEGIHKAIEQMILGHNELMYVGDSIMDFQAARDAGIYFGAALWPKTTEEIRQIKEKIQPDHTTIFLKTPEDLLNHLQKAE